MASLVEKMALIGQASWHGLEEVMPEGATLDQWRAIAGLSHAVNKTPIVFVDDVGVVHVSDDRFALYRNDTKKLLSVVAKGYKVHQPDDILNFFDTLIRDNGFTMETAGSLAGGKRIWALAKSGNAFTIGTNDVVKQYLLLATSYDGSLATTGKHTSTRVVCNNTMEVALNSGEPAVKVYHSSDFDATKIKIDLGLMEDEWEKFKESAGIMHRIQLTPTQAARWYAELLLERELTDEEVVAEAEGNRILKDLMQVYTSGKGAEPTLWGIVNGITAMADHVRGRGADTRLNSAWFGQGATLKGKAWDKAMDRVLAIA